MQVFTAIACLLAIAALLSYINDRFLHLPHHIGLLLLALVATVLLLALEAGGAPRGLAEKLHQLTDLFTLSETLLKGVLCFMLFYGSLHIRWAALHSQRWLALSLATVGTTIATFVTGGLIYEAMSSIGMALTLAQALVFGALISATDPVAAIAILSKVGLPEHLRTAVEGESLFNDGVAIVLFSIFSAAAMGGQVPLLADIGTILIREILGGVLLGFAGWAVLHTLLVRTDKYATCLLVSLGAVSGIFAVAQQVDVSGPVATVVAGLLCGDRTLPKLDAVLLTKTLDFWEGLDEVLNSLLFVFVGIHVELIDPLAETLPGVPALAAIVAVLVVRGLTVSVIIRSLTTLGLLHSKNPWGLTKFLSWAGLRGGVSLAMAVSLPESPWQYLILNMTFAAVVFSIVVQGLTIKRLFGTDELAEML
jgi:monovalent cation:H+ antiporter, CPA1 family